MKNIKFLILAVCLVLAVSIVFAKGKLFNDNSPDNTDTAQETESVSTDNSTVSTEKGDFKKRNVAIVLYEGVQLLDFAGPGEVFTDTETDKGEAAFNVYTVAASTAPIVSQGFVRITPQYNFENAPKPDIVIFPGGDAAGFFKNEDSLARAKKLAVNSEVTMSVCTGARILGKAGLLDNKKVTTHWIAIDNLRKEVPSATVLENTRFIDNGQIITTAGISAGIDGALHLVQRLIGTESAVKTARAMEYNWQPPK